MARHRGRSRAEHNLRNIPPPLVLEPPLRSLSLAPLSSALFLPPSPRDHRSFFVGNVGFFIPSSLLTCVSGSWPENFPRPNPDNRRGNRRVSKRWNIYIGISTLSLHTGEDTTGVSLRNLAYISLSLSLALSL